MQMGQQWQFVPQQQMQQQFVAMPGQQQQVMLVSTNQDGNVQMPVQQQVMGNSVFVGAQMAQQPGQAAQMNGNMMGQQSLFYSANPEEASAADTATWRH